MQIHRICTSAATGIMSHFKMSSLMCYTWLLILLMHGLTHARSLSSQNDDLTEYLGRVDEKIRTLMTIVRQERAMPPLPGKVTNRKDLPNVHPWRSLPDTAYAPVDEWQEKLLARHRQQQSNSDSHNQEIMRQISREVDKITELVKRLDRSEETPYQSPSGERASKYPYSPSSQIDPGIFDDEGIVEPERPWRDTDQGSTTRREELKRLLQNLDRTLKVIEFYQSDDDDEPKEQNQKPAQVKPPADPIAVKADVDNGELELMNLLEENSKQGDDPQKGDSKQAAPPQPPQNAENKDTKSAQKQPSQQLPPEANKENQMQQGAEKKEAVRKTLARLMNDMKDLENQVSSSHQLSQAQQLHERILQLAEKLGNPPR